MVALKKPIELDDRGRLTLPSELRRGVQFFSIEREEGGVIRLIPQRTVSLEDAELIESLRLSAAQLKANQIEPIPSEWL